MTLANNLEPILGVVVGAYAQTIQLACINVDGVAQDISAYTTLTVVGKSPDRRKTATATATYVNAGVDGLIQFSWADGDIDRPGNWELQVELSTGSKMTKSYVATMMVGKALRET
jgi:hypothetical protein